MATEDLRLIANGGTAIEVDSVASSDTTGVFQSAAASTLDLVAIPNNANYYRYSDSGSTSTYGIGDRFSLKFNQTFSGGASQYCDVFVGFGDTVGCITQQVNALGLLLEGAETSYVNCFPFGRKANVNVGGSVGASSLAEATDRWALLGFYSSLGQFGASVVQVFTEAGHINISSTATKVFADAQGTYRYFYHAATYNAGTAYTLTGPVSDIEIFQNGAPAGVDLTPDANCIETDTGTGRLTVYADCIVATALNIANSETAKHVAIDEGADFFGDYTVSGVLNITAFGGAGTLMQYFEILTVCDAAASSEALNDSQGIAIYWVSATTFKPYIHQAISGSDSFSTVGPTLNTNRPYSFTLSRSGTTLTLKVWNDLVLTNFAGTSQVGSTLTWTGRAITTYRYLLPVTSYLNGATSRSSTFTLGGVQRQGNPTQSASHTSDGGFRIGGSATNSRSAYATGSGGFRLGGSATHSRSTAYIATGGFIIGGAADFSANGAASVSYTSSGGFIIGGTAENSRSSSHTGSGGFRLGGSAAYSFTLQTNVQEIVFELYDSTGAPITGATTLTCKLRTTPGAQIYDWSDETFKSSGWTTISTDMNEIDATNLPGVYKKEIDVSNFADGRYQVFISYSATQSQHGSIEFLVDDGQMVDEYTATNTHTALIDIAATPAAVLAAATTTPIAANMEQTNGYNLKGDGSAGDKFRSVLAP